jgi:hypothetical protein
MITPTRLHLLVPMAFVLIAVGGLVVVAQRGVPPRTAADDGFTDTPMLPNQPWHVHDPKRPNPPVVTPGATVGAAPSDATVLFDGKDLSQWAQRGTGANAGVLLEPKWPVRDGYFETGARSGSLYSRATFGDVQLHVEWAAPTVVVGNSQGRGNSGIYLMSLYEIQVLDSFENRTYADGQAGAIYGQWPPLANAARKPGEWQTYDIIFEAPKFENGKVTKPAFQTVLWNGVIVHNRKELLGATIYRNVATYAPHEAMMPIMLQDHNNPVRYRNIWARPLRQYDQAGK